MILLNFPHDLHAICDRLSTMDADLGSIIREHGYPPLWKRPNTFESLVHFILEQQVSLASALAALNQLKAKTGCIEPFAILQLTDEEMRSCYVSRQKMGYLRGIAKAIDSGALDLSSLEALEDDKVRHELLQLKGVGQWTADVYLMFVLHRPDIFPIGDLAAVQAIKRLKHLARDITKETIIQVSKQWQPYRTVATMILWHHYLSLPIKKSKKDAW